MTIGTLNTHTHYTCAIPSRNLSAQSQRQLALAAKGVTKVKTEEQKTPKANTFLPPKIRDKNPPGI